jgi:hypothetical protein
MNPVQNNSYRTSIADEMREEYRRRVSEVKNEQSQVRAGMMASRLRTAVSTSSRL